MLRAHAHEIIKKAFASGKNLEECRIELLIEAENQGIPYPDERMVISVFNDIDEYNQFVISERAKNTARPHYERVKFWRELDNMDPETTMPHWYRYQKSLENNGWPIEDINSVQYSSSDILDAIMDAQERKWQTGKNNPIKGLVIGHVQSGKTASMAGVMALAADFNYDMVIVLSGVHNALNYQTTRRFENDLWTYTKYGEEHRPRHEAQDVVQFMKQNRQSWYNITVDTDHLPTKRNSFVDLAKPIFGVFKKNVRVLKRLNKWIKNNGHFFGQDFRLLIIDDECDQASPNTADYKKGDETATNRQLCDLIYNEFFPMVTYIGYTATPFATILNEPPGDRSLYPEDFIHKLKKPARHFGANEVFGSETNDEVPMAVIMKPESDGITDEDALFSKELRKAVAYFLCACASRNYLREYKKYSTMLVHTSSRIADHHDWINYIKEILDEYRQKPALMRRECHEIWLNEKNRLTPAKLSEIFRLDESEFTQTEDFDEIQKHLEKVLRGDEKFAPLKLCVDNSKPGSYERLSYPDFETSNVKPNPIIVVGGNTLSRGLTLEGLTVSFFLRDVNQMDSLLQMGRWFGYRRGYEDLVRVWTTNMTLGYFRHVCDVESDLREQIDSLYTNSGATPDQVALTVKTHPSMKVVRKSAMQAATFKAVYFGSAPQTTYFRHKDYKWLRKNWDVANQLLRKLHFNNIPVAQTTAINIIEFLDNISVHNVHEPAMGPNNLSRFIKNANDNNHLLNWNVAVASKLSKPDSDPGKLENYQLILRTKLQGPVAGYPNDANIKALRSPGDLFIDLNPDKTDTEEVRISKINSPGKRVELMRKRNIPEEKRPGLLLLYPIKKSAEPQDKIKDGREDLDAAHEVLGWSIVFPEAATKNMKDLYDRVGIELE
jgi:hypothetical protein